MADTDLPEGFELDESSLPPDFELDKPSPLMGMATAAAQGVNVGLEQAAALPFELSSALMNLRVGEFRPDYSEDEKVSLANLLGVDQAQPLVSTEQLQELGAKLGFNYADIEDVPEQFRPAARAGEAVGGAVPFALAPYAGAAKAGLKEATGPFRAFVEPARKAPVKTGLMEFSATVGSGVGAGVAEAVSPDNPLTRFGGELAGGLLSPFAVFGRITGRLTGGLVDLSRRARQAFSPAAAEEGAARHVQDIVRLFGEDPQSVARALSPGGIAELGPASDAGSLGLLALEKSLVNNSQQFGLEVQRDLRRAIDQLHFAFNEVAGAGSPEALRNLALARKEYARVLIDTNVSLAERRAVEAAESVVPNSSTNTATNRRAKELLLEAEKDARVVESEVWGEIDKTLTLQPSGLRETYNTKVTAGLLPGEDVGLPAPIMAEIKRLTKKGAKPATVEHMLRLRSRILNEIRKEGGSQAPDRDRIGRLHILQESILDDLSMIPGTDEARAFSKDLNDRFTRGYVGDLLARNPRGGERIPGDVSLSGALPGKEGLLASEQMEAATKPFGRMEPNSRLEEMRGLEEEIVRDMAASTFNPDGSVSPNALSRFRQKNKELLSNFPELDQVLSDASTTASIYGKRVKRLHALDKRIQAQSAFSKVLGAEDPAVVMRAALTGKSPITDMDRIFLLARSDPKAVDGARRTFLDMILNESTATLNLAGKEVNAISGKKLRDLLNTGDGGVLQSAKKAGILNDGHVKRLNQIAEEADKINSALNFPGRLDQIIEDPSALTDIVARAVGANLGSHSIIAKTTGAQLVMAAAGSRLMRKVLEKTPALNITRVLESAVRNPELMRTLLTKNVGPGAVDAAAAKATRLLREEGVLKAAGKFVGIDAPLGPLGTATTEIPEIMEE